MSKKVVLLFSGQGAQSVGMGQALATSSAVARRVLEQADEVLGFSLTSVMFEGPMEELTRTSRCQPALYAHGLACLAALQDALPGLEIAAAAGLSLGAAFDVGCAVGRTSFDLSAVYDRVVGSCFSGARPF
jgi:[acyl-carrier-protein] S-malonyltransferase